MIGCEVECGWVMQVCVVGILVATMVDVCLVGYVMEDVEREREQQPGSCP
jgi:hypothetical protein